MIGHTLISFRHSIFRSFTTETYTKWDSNKVSNSLLLSHSQDPLLFWDTSLPINIPWSPNILNPHAVHLEQWGILRTRECVTGCQYWKTILQQELYYPNISWLSFHQCPCSRTSRNRWFTLNITSFQNKSSGQVLYGAYFLVPWLSTEDQNVQSAFNIRCGIDMDKKSKIYQWVNQVNSVVEKL